jgi:GNAT superfamily N-acetyltransferase
MWIRPATLADAAAVAGLLSLLRDDYPTTDAERFISDDNRACFVAEEDERLVGAATAVILTANEALPRAHTSLVAQLQLASSLAILNDNVVVPTARRHGIGSRLVSVRLDWARAQNIDDVICEAWVYPDGSTPAASLLRRNGFALVAEVADYWKLESVEQGYSCAICGTPCRCACALFRRSL